MNRRKFLFGAIIAPLGAMLPIGYVSWLQTKPKSYLFVVERQAQAVALYKQMGRPENVKVISTGSAICGYGADLIVMDTDWDRGGDYSWEYRKHISDWYHSALRTRLYPGGKIIRKDLI